jgi:hypothetical protein
MKPNPVSLRPLTLTFLALAIGLGPMGIVWHEIVGHGLSGLLCGGRITRVQCLGLQVVPFIAWTGLGEGLGATDVVDIPTKKGENLTLLAGSMSTWLAAAVALVILRRRRARGLGRLALTGVGLWSLDLVTFTLPSLGWHRYIWFGTTYSEPYEAAVALGIPGRLFQVVAIGGGLLVLAGFFFPLRSERVEPGTTKDVRGPRRSVLMLRSSLALLVLAAAAGGAWYWRTHRPVPVPPSPPTNWARNPATRVLDWQEDIDALTRELPKRHRNAFFHCKRGDFEAAAASLRRRVPQLSDDEVVVGLMTLTAMIGDAHTAIDVGSLKPAFRSLPLSLYVFSDGPVIIAAREPQKDLIGCLLVKFAGVSPDEAFRRVATASAYENESTFVEMAPRLLRVPEIAHAVGLIPTVDRATIVVRGARGEEREVKLAPMEPGEKLVTGVMGGVEKAKLPLGRQSRPHRNWWQLLPGQRALYFRYDTCADEPDRTVASLSDEMLAAIDAGSVERVIVDLRRNGGGDSGLLEPFVRGLRRRPAVNRPGGVVVLIGRHTFSSAHMHAVDLKDALGATLIGEPTGQKPNAYGEIRWLTLPHSQIVVRYSTKYWHTAPGDPPSLEPDVFVGLSSADYFALEDPVLEAALRLGTK